MNLYDMDMRDYDPAIARWTGVDPVTHFSQSPYNAFDGNPVYFSDPSGADGLPPEPINTWHYAGGNQMFTGAGHLSAGDHMFGNSGDDFWNGQTNWTGGDLAWSNYNNDIRRSSVSVDGLIQIFQTENPNLELAKSIVGEYGGNLNEIVNWLDKHPFQNTKTGLTFKGINNIYTKSDRSENKDALIVKISSFILGKIIKGSSVLTSATSLRENTPSEILAKKQRIELHQNILIGVMFGETLINGQRTSYYEAIYKNR